MLPELAGYTSGAHQARERPSGSRDSPGREMPWWGANKPKVKDYVVKTVWGEVQGRRKDKRAVFYGIPYAAPPVGPLRFQKPCDPSPWPGVRCCRGPCPQAVQSFSLVFRPFVPCRLLGRLLEGIVWLLGRDPRANTNLHRPQRLPRSMSEDCLYLDIEVPLPMFKATEEEEDEGHSGGGGKQALRPVMVWFHGGSFQVGSSSHFAYEPSTRGHGLCLQGGVIVVKVQYRVGLWGFLKLDGGDANNGIWDQVKALQWVQANIGAFGGDRDNVTIFGQSAGGISVGIHLLAPPSQGLFHKAILSSGSLQPAVPIAEHRAHVITPLATILSPLLPPPPSSSSSPALSVEMLRGVGAAQLLCAQCVLILQSGQRDCLEAGPLLLQPVSDGELLPLPFPSHQQGGGPMTMTTKLQHLIQHGLPRGSSLKGVMVGYCRDEDGLFAALTPSHFQCTDEKQCRERVRELLTDTAPPSEALLDSAMQELQAYHRGLMARGEGPIMVQRGHEWTQLYTAISGLYRFILPSHLTAHALLHCHKTRGGGGEGEGEGASPRVYMFRFDVGNVRLSKGAVHSMDLPYVFGTTRLSKPLLPGSLRDNHRLHEVVAGAFTSFAHTGTPSLPLPSTLPSSSPSLPAPAPAPASSSSPSLPWPPLCPSSTGHAVVVLDVPSGVSSGVRVEGVGLEEALPTTWALATMHGQHRPLFWVHA